MVSEKIVGKRNQEGFFRNYRMNYLIEFYLHKDNLPLIGQVGRVFANSPVDRGSISDDFIPKTQKMILDTTPA